MADLAAFQPVEISHEVHSPVNEDFKLGLTVSLIPTSHPKMKALQFEISNKQRQKRARNKPITSEEVDINVRKLIFTGMTGWSWGKDSKDEQANFKGEQPAFTESNVMAIFDALPWLQEQLMKVLDEDSNFFDI